jgi:hypothetical protein
MTLNPLSLIGIGALACVVIGAAVWFALAPSTHRPAIGWLGVLLLICVAAVGLIYARAVGWLR